MSMLSLTLNKLKGAVDFISDNDVEINTVLTLIDHSPSRILWFNLTVYFSVLAVAAS